MLLEEGSSFLRGGLLSPTAAKARYFSLLKSVVTLWIFNRDLLLVWDQCFIRWGIFDHGYALSERHIVGWLVELDRFHVRLALG